MGSYEQCTPVKHKQILFPPACSSPLITKALPGSWLGRYKRTSTTSTRRPLSTQSVQCTVSQSVYSTISFRLHVCYQPGQTKWRVGSNVYGWNFFAEDNIRYIFHILCSLFFFCAYVSIFSKINEILLHQLPTQRIVLCASGIRLLHKKLLSLRNLK